MINTSTMSIYLTESQHDRLVYHCSLFLLENIFNSKSIETIYLLKIPKQVKKEINKLPEQDRGALISLLFRAVTDFDNLPSHNNRHYKDDINVRQLLNQ